MFDRIGSRSSFRDVQTVTFGAAVSVSAGALAQVATIRALGVSRAGDAYAAAVTVPIFAISTLVGSFAAALVPTYWRFRNDEGEEAADHAFLGPLLTRFAMLTAAVAGLGIALTHPTIRLLVPGLDPGSKDQASLLAMVLWPSLPLAAVAAVLSSHSYANSRYRRPALAQAFPACGVIAGALLGPTLHLMSGFAIVLGRDVGFVVAIAFLLRRTPMYLSLRPVSDHQRMLSAFFRPSLLILALANSCSLIVPLVERHWASTLPTGDVSALFFAAQLTAVTTTVVTQGIGVVSATSFARSAAGGARASLDPRRVLRPTILAGVVATGGCLLTVIGVRLAASPSWQFGAMKHADIRLVARLYSIYAFITIPSAIGSVIGTYYISRRRYSAYAVLSVAGVSAYLVASYAAHRSGSVYLLAASAHAFWWFPPLLLVLLFVIETRRGPAT
jgi:putative peptidoglycan lipid II flippase